MITAYWWNSVPNAGDYYSAWLLNKLVGEVSLSIENPDIVCCGSILSDHTIGKNTKIWGVGFNNEDSITASENMDNYFAVRGKLTYKKLKTNKKIAFGDTGLLLSKFYTPSKYKKYKYGLVSHYSDYNFINSKKELSDIFHIINMNTTNVQNVIEEIDKCEFIFSSSLHGIIFAHSLGIPAIHLEFKPLSSKNNFKFKDYYSVLDIEYTKEIFNEDLKFLDKYDSSLSKNDYVPSMERVAKIQQDLLAAFPLTQTAAEKHDCERLTEEIVKMREKIAAQSETGQFEQITFNFLNDVNNNENPGIDLVVLYVDSSDTQWQEEYKKYAPNNTNVEIVGKQRFRKNNNFKYWFRCVEKYVPWVNNIFLVVQSKSQVPDWVDADKIKIVLHEDFMPKDFLPVFNSQAIEMFLWNIPGLSEKFLYSNDDTYFVGPLAQDDFFENNKVKTSFHRAMIGNKDNAPLWKQSILNSGLLANKEEQETLTKQGHYITPTHTIRPYLKSMMIELFIQNQPEILSSISKFRAENNFTVYMYDFYLKYRGLTIKKNYAVVYHSSKTPVGMIANTLINPTVYKIICINDTEEEENLEKEKKLTVQFQNYFPTKSKYEK